MIIAHISQHSCAPPPEHVIRYIPYTDSAHRDLKARLEKFVSEFPSCIRYQTGDLANPNIDPQTLYYRLIIELERLQNVFFIERLLIRHGREDTGDLLMVSIDMVT